MTALKSFSSIPDSYNNHKDKDILCSNFIWI